MELIHALNAAQLSVQLKHDPTETRDKQWVTLLNSNGDILSHNDNVQHNRSWNDRKALLTAMAQEAIAKVKEAVDALKA